MVPGGKYLRTNPVKSSVSWDKIHGKKYTQKNINEQNGRPKNCICSPRHTEPSSFGHVQQERCVVLQKEARSSSFSSNSDWQSTPPSHWSVPESALTVLVCFAFPSRTSLKGFCDLSKQKTTLCKTSKLGHNNDIKSSALHSSHFVGNGSATEL